MPAPMDTGGILDGVLPQVDSGFQMGYQVQKDRAGARAAALKRAMEQSKMDEDAQHHRALEGHNSNMEAETNRYNSGMLGYHQGQLGVDQEKNTRAAAMEDAKPFEEEVTKLGPALTMYAPKQAGEMGEIARGVAARAYPKTPSAVFPGMDLRTGSLIPGEVTNGPSELENASGRFRKAQEAAGPLMAAGKLDEIKSSPRATMQFDRAVERAGKDFEPLAQQKTDLEHIRGIAAGDGPITGIGPFEGRVPDMLTSQEGIMNRQAAGRVLNAMLKEQSGTAVSTQELERQLAARGLGPTASDRAFREGARELMQEANDFYSHRGAKYAPGVMQTLQSRGGVTQPPAPLPPRETSVLDKPGAGDRAAQVMSSALDGAKKMSPWSGGPGAAKVRVMGPNGERGTVPAGKKLPQGWRVVD